MNIKSGRNPVRRVPQATGSGASPMSKLIPALFIIFMIVMVACVCQLHVYFKSRISVLALEIDNTKRNIRNTQLELQNLRNKIEERNRWSYIKRQIQRYGIKLQRPQAGQMHHITMLPAKTIRLAAENMQQRELRRSAMLNVKASGVRNTRTSARRNAAR